MPSESRFTPDRAVLIGLLLTAFAYCRDLKYDFILDDVQLILMNPATFSWSTIKTVFTTDIFLFRGPTVPIAVPAIHYRPIYIIWLMLNRQLFGSVLPWWHLTSLVLHLCVSLLVYKLACSLMKNQWAAALAALIFAFHPIHVESVSYVSASTDLLVTLFLLISFLCYARYREQECSAGYMAIAVLSAALAMLSKETAAIFPWLLVGYEALRKAPAEPRRPYMKYLFTLPFFGLVAIYALIRELLFGHNIGQGPGGSRLAALVDTPLVLITYLRNLLWPHALSFFYPVVWSSRWNFLSFIGLLLALIATVFLWRHSRANCDLRLQIVWAACLFVIPMLAVVTFAREDWVHDRHMYLVSVPLCMIAATLLTDAHLPRKLTLVLSAFALAGLLMETVVQVPRFTDEISIYESALQVAPQSLAAHRYYAFALSSYGRNEEAFRQFRIVEQLRPADSASYENYAEALGTVGRDDEAAAEYNKALQLTAKPTPNRAYLLYRLAMIALKHSKPEEAEAYLRESLQIDPNVSNYHAGLADALRQQGRMLEAEQQMRLQTGVQIGLNKVEPISTK